LFGQIRAVVLDQPVAQLGSAAGETDRINRSVVLQSEDRSWREVHGQFQTSVQQLLHTTGSLSESDLFVPGRFQAVDSEPLWRCIAGETYEHYHLHRQQIAVWLKTVSGTC
jgi:hypothetical protein